MTRAERYEDRKLRRVCIDCEAGLDSDPRVRCPECRERCARSDRARAASGERRYAASPQALSTRYASKRRRRDERKTSGRCVQDYCPEAALDDSVYCERHRSMHVEANRRYYAKHHAKHGKNPPPVATTCLLPSSTERARV